nr:Gag-Pol polyprotein [Tanacetum cinerariifolium]
MKQDGNKKDQSHHYAILQDVEQYKDLVKVKIRMNIKDLVKIRSKQSELKRSKEFFNLHTPVSVVGPSRALNDAKPSYPNDSLMPHLEDIHASLTTGIFTNSSYDDEGVVSDFNNLEIIMNLSRTPTTRIHAIPPKTQILGDPLSVVQTRSKNPKRSLKHWKMNVGLMLCKRNCCSSRFRRYGFWLICLLERKLLELVYQMDVKSAFMYGTVDEEVYVIQPPRFVDPKFPNKVYKVVKALYGLHQAPRAWYATLSNFLEQIYQMDVKSAFMYGTVDEEVYVTQPPRFVDPKFPNKVYKVVKALYGLHQAPRACVKTTSTPIETQKPLVKDEEVVDVDVHLYRGGYLKLLLPRKGHYCQASVNDAKHRLMLLSEQMALGKDFSNPFMAGSLPKI